MPIMLTAAQEQQLINASAKVQEALRELDRAEKIGLDVTPHREALKDLELMRRKLLQVYGSAIARRRA